MKLFGLLLLTCAFWASQIDSIPAPGSMYTKYRSLCVNPNASEIRLSSFVYAKEVQCSSKCNADPLNCGMFQIISVNNTCNTFYPVTAAYFAANTFSNALCTLWVDSFNYSTIVDLREPPWLSTYPLYKRGYIGSSEVLIFCNYAGTSTVPYSQYQSTLESYCQAFGFHLARMFSQTDLNNLLPTLSPVNFDRCSSPVIGMTFNDSTNTLIYPPFWTWVNYYWSPSVYYHSLNSYYTFITLSKNGQLTAYSTGYSPYAFMCTP